MLARCFMVNRFTSKNRSTQFARHPCSFLSSADPLMLPVTHFFQQTSVRTWLSVRKKKKNWSASVGYTVRGHSTQQCQHRCGCDGSWGREGDGGQGNDIRCCIRARCSLLVRNWRSSDLSLSLSLSRSACCKEVSMFNGVGVLVR